KSQGLIGFSHLRLFFLISISRMERNKSFLIMETLRPKESMLRPKGLVTGDIITIREKFLQKENTLMVSKWGHGCSIMEMVRLNPKANTCMIKNTEPGKNGTAMVS